MGKHWIPPVCLVFVIGWTQAGCDRSQPNPVQANAIGSGAESSEADSERLTRKPPSESDSEAFNISRPTDSVSAGGAPLGSDVAPNQLEEVAERPAANPQAGAGTGADGVFQPESVGIRAPVADTPAEQEPAKSSQYREFATLKPVVSDEPEVLLAHLRDVDDALSALVIAGSGEQLPKEDFVTYGKRLGEMKLQAGQRLANAKEASEEQKTSGVLAQLIALSHMSGLGDVRSAQQLQGLAETLESSSNPELAHQSRVVLLGFELQALQNGQAAVPDEILGRIEGLFTRPQDRNFPEFMICQQAIAVLEQMGFSAEAGKAKSMLVTEYQHSSDAQLRNSAWNIATAGSQALQNYNVASQGIGDPGFDPQPLLEAARVMIAEFPSEQTLEEVARSLANIEYSGEVQLSQRMADLVGTRLAPDSQSAAATAVRRWLKDHKARMAILGSELDLSDLRTLDGQPFDPSAYQGKVVLVDF